MLNLDSRSRSKLVWIATLLSPVVAVQGVRFITGASPSAASAAVSAAAPDMPALPAGDAAKALTPAQANALRWLQSRSGAAARRSPMDRPDQPAEVETPPQPRPAPAIIPDAPKPTDEAPRDLVLNGMIAGGPGGFSLCTINHRIRRVGEEVWPAWRITRIDGRQRIVVLSGPDGRTAILTPPTPSAERTLD